MSRSAEPRKAANAAGTLRTLRAENASPLTLDGTRAYLLGSDQVAVIDPGPAIDAHLDALVHAIGTAASVAILLTHHHADHAEAALPLRGRLEVPTEIVDPEAMPMVQTDAGELHAVRTPGHTPDHYSYWWPAGRAVFCGDLLMGGLDTTLVAPPEGDLGAYLDSLEKLRTLNPATIYPAHGEPYQDPPAALDRYLRHRQEREAQVLAGLADGLKDADQLTHRVYGETVTPALWPYARSAIDAYLQHLERSGRIRRGAAGWERTR